MKKKIGNSLIVFLSGLLLYGIAGTYDKDMDELPEKWCCESEGKLPAVREQGSRNICWALSAACGIESARLPQNQDVISAEHMVKNSKFSLVEEQGNHIITMAYMAGWQGPVTQEHYEEALQTGEEPQADIHVQEIQYFDDADTETIKQYVYENGTMQTSLYMNFASTSDTSEYYNKETDAYFVPDEEQENHIVLIVGWDDTYARENFKTAPEEDGAFICLNTWGTDFGENGLFYVSYEGVNIGESSTAYTRVEEADNYGDIYQTDDYGWQFEAGYETNECWFANVYTARTDERIKAVGFYITKPEKSCEIYYIADYQNEDSLQEGQLLQTEYFEQAGYYTVDFEKEIEVEKGKNFAIIVREQGEDTVTAAVESGAGEYIQGITLEGKRGFLSNDGKEWMNTESNMQANVCLKVYVG